VNQIVSITAKQLWDPFPDTSYLESPGSEERYHQYQDGRFGFIGIRAEAEIVVNGVCQIITSGGLWGIESDSDLQYLAEIEHEEVDQLKAILGSLLLRIEAGTWQLRPTAWTTGGTPCSWTTTKPAKEP
jgi:hypothetical protein